MNEETRRMIEALASKLGTTVEHLWGVLLRQAYISFWTDILYYLITVAIVLFAIKFSLKAWRKGDESTWNDDEWRLLSIGLGLLALILTIVAIVCISDTVTKIANPEYWALKELLATVKSK